MAGDWRYQSLASLALACGHHSTARALARAGCPEGSFGQVLEEAQASDRHTIANLAARIETETLFEATTKSASENLPAGRKNLRV